jgi:WD40 repeat protein
MVAFHSTAHTTGDSPIPHVERRRTPDITLRDLAPIMRLSKIILAPIALTTGLLYLLLRYLLKNAELLEAQRHKGEADSASPAVPLAEVEDGVTFSTLFRALSSDVELVDASLDGEVIVCASLNSEVVVWFGKAGDYHSTLDGSVVLTHSENCVGTDQVTSIAVDPEGQYCAVGSDDGAVGLFCLEKDNTPSNVIQPTSIFRRGGHPVSSLFFVERGSLLFVSPGTPTTTIVAAYENGDAVEWDFHNSAISEIQSSHPRSDSKPFFPSQIRGRNSSFRVAFALEDGSLEVMGRGVGANSWATMCILPAGTFQDPVCAVHMERLAIDKDTCDILVTGTYNGKVAFWDGSKGDRIGYLDDVRGPIDRLLLASIPPRPCPQCSEPSVDSFTCAISSGDLVHIYRGSIPFQPNRCSCLSSQLVAPSSSDNFRSKSGSMASSGNSSPVRTRIKLPTVGGPPTNPSAPPYTVSPHSRRSSGVERTDREPNGRARQPSVNIGKDVDTAILEPMSLSQSASPFGESPPKSSWSNFRLKKIAGIACDRGDWDLRNHLVVGIRRRAKSLSPKGGGVRPNSIPRTRLTPSVLDRWEFWTFDPSLQMNWSRASSLSYIVSEAVSSSPQESRRPKSRVRLEFVVLQKLSPFLTTTL